MNVLLIQLKMGHRRELIYPIGLSCIANALNKNGHKISTIDMNTEEEPVLSIKEQLNELKPQVVGISIRNTDYPEEKNVVSQIKKVTFLIKSFNQETIIVAGGTGYSIFAKEIMEEVQDIDYGVFLEGEKTIAEFLQNMENPEKVKGIWYRKDGNILFTAPRSPDDLGNYQTSWNFFDINKYKFIEKKENLFGIGIESKRGCIFNCVYCLYPFLSSHRIRARNPVNVLDDIENLQKKYNVNYFVFTDPVFNVPLGHASEICKEMVRRKIMIKWSAWFKEKNITEEFMRLAVDAGCIEFAFSPDGYIDDTLKKLQKDITKKDIDKTVSIARKVKGANVSYNFFFFPPGQTLLGIIMLIIFRVRVKLVLGEKLKGCGFSLIHLYPKTILYDYALKERLISEDVNLLNRNITYYPPNLKLISKLFYYLWTFKQSKLRRRRDERFV